jgi:glycerophosphoryl diester phosphodiesterase
MKRHVLNIAHRGASADFPENTVAAFSAAVASGAEMCELDVQRTADGVLVIIHDETIDRTTDGSGRILGMTAAQLASCDAGSWRGPRFAGERIPTLQQVFELITSHCALNIELKADGIEEQVCATIRAFKAESSIIISSFDWKALANVRRIASEIQVGLLASRAPAKLLKAAVEMKAFAVHPRCDLISVEFCVEAHRHGLQIYTWTVDEPAIMRRLISAGVDGIMTNYPARLRVVLKEDGALRSR